MTMNGSVSHEPMEESAESRDRQEIIREIRAELEERDLTEISPAEAEALFLRAYPELSKADLEEMVSRSGSFTHVPLPANENGPTVTEGAATKGITGRLSQLPDIDLGEQVDALTCLLEANWQSCTSEALLSIPLYLYATFSHACTVSIANALKDAQKIYEWRSKEFGTPEGWSQIAWICFLINAEVLSRRMLEVDAKNGGHGCLLKWWPEFNLFHIADPPPTKASVAAVSRKYLKKQQPLSLRRDIYGNDNPEVRGLREQLKHCIRQSVWHAVAQPLQDRLGVPLIKMGKHQQGSITLTYGSTFKPSVVKLHMDDAGNFAIRELTFAWETSLELVLNLPAIPVEVNLPFQLPCLLVPPLTPDIPRIATASHTFFEGERDFVLSTPNVTPAVSPELTVLGKLDVDDLLRCRFRLLSIDLDLFDPGAAFDTFCDEVMSPFDSQLVDLVNNAFSSMCENASFTPDYALDVNRNAARKALKAAADVTTKITEVLVGQGATLSAIGLMAYLLGVGDDFNEWLSEKFSVPIGLENFTLTRLANVISESFEVEL